MNAVLNIVDFENKFEAILENKIVIKEIKPPPFTKCSQNLRDFID